MSDRPSSMLTKPAGKTAAVGGGIGAVILSAVGLMFQQSSASNEQLRAELVAIREANGQMQVVMARQAEKIDALKTGLVEVKNAVKAAADDGIKVIITEDQSRRGRR